MKNITILSCLFFGLLSGNVHAQGLNCQWAKSMGETRRTRARSVATDPFGNSFVTGDFSGSSVSLGATTLTNAGVSNIYLAKYDSAGNVLWARSAKGDNSDEAYQVAADRSGNPIITGYFLSYPFIIGTDTLSNNVSRWGQYMFVAKYDPAGNLLWTHHAAEGNAHALALATDPTDNIFVTGLFSASSIVFGTDTLTDATIDAFGNIFLVKYNSAGNVLWAVGGDATNQGAFHSLATDAYGNVYTTGFVTSPVFQLGSFVLNNPGAGSRQVIIAKISPAGRVVWARLSSSCNGWGSAIAIDDAGNPYVTGTFRSDSVTFGTLTAHNHAFNDTFENAAMFVAKYDTAGNVLWVREEAFDRAVSGGVVGTDITTDHQNRAYITGSFMGSHLLVYGSDTLYADSTHDFNLFVAAYDAAGNLLWAKSPTGSGSCGSSGIATDDSGALYVCGEYGYEDMNFGTISLTAGSGGRAFVAKIAPVRTSVTNITQYNGNIEVYPIPASNAITVQLPGSGYTALIISDLSGREVITKMCNMYENDRVYKFDISQLASGVYTAQALQNGLKINRRIVVVRD